MRRASSSEVVETARAVASETVLIEVVRMPARPLVAADSMPGAKGHVLKHENHIKITTNRTNHDSISKNIQWLRLCRRPLSFENRNLVASELLKIFSLQCENACSSEVDATIRTSVDIVYLCLLHFWRLTFRRNWLYSRLTCTQAIQATISSLAFMALWRSETESDSK